MLRGCGVIGTLVYSQRRDKMVQPLWRWYGGSSKYLKYNYHFIPQSHFWVYIQKKWNQHLSGRAALPGSLQRYSRHLRNGEQNGRVQAVGEEGNRGSPEVTVSVGFCSMSAFRRPAPQHRVWSQRYCTARLKCAERVDLRIGVLTVN